jgi:ADP-dependent NAD(P)H-hydrate dehydratase / NAD(P)H-hydrate epimerase
MRYALTAEQTRAAEAVAVERGATLRDLMEAAGLAVADEVGVRVPEGRVAVAAGSGNNGGDGWVCARVLHERGRDVIVVSVADPSKLADPAADAAREAIAAGVAYTLPSSPGEAVVEFGRAVCIVDALLGIGIRGEAREPAASLIAAIDDSDAVIISVDLPSGVDGDTGTAVGAAVAADATVTFSTLKAGCVLQPGAALSGHITVAEVGVPSDALAPVGAIEVWEDEDLAEVLPRPDILASKGTRGRVLIVGGAPGLTGAVCMAASSALRSGAGYVTVAVPAPSMKVVEIKLTAPVKRALPADASGALGPEAVEAVLDAARHADSVVLGPGLGRSGETVAAARELIRRLQLPLVIDADALFALGSDLSLVAHRTAPTVLTPHHGEAGRLLDLAVDAVEADRVDAVRALARGTCVALLKGPATLVAGRGRVAANATGGPGLATLGTGDVLAGVIGALLAQGAGPFDAAVLGAYLHGAAGDAASCELTPVCCTAEDVIGYLPEAFARLF